MELIEVKISDITLTNVGFAIFLKPQDYPEQKVVPIFIGPLETHAITSVLDGVTPPRPMTHDLIMMFIPALGAQVVKVTIDEIVDSTFYAKISLRKDEEIFLIDARPSDSIAIALRADAPIFISKKVLDEAGIFMKDNELSTSKENFSGEEFSALLSENVNTPKSNLEILQDKLLKALTAEDYENAAKLRDQIKKIIDNT